MFIISLTPVSNEKSVQVTKVDKFNLDVILYIYFIINHR